MKRVYLDYAASTPAHPKVVAAMQPYLSEKFGNPSSIHSFGQETRTAIESAREKVAHLIGARPEEIVFTSGGTEADNFALEGVAFANEKKGNHLIVSSVEHHAVTECAEFLKQRGFQITYLPVDRTGLVNPDDVARAITDKTILVSVMHANNEVGTIEPIKEIGTRVKERGVIFHVDAVQTIGHIPVKIDDLGADLVALSGHKLYGPKGVGALYIKKGTRIGRFIHGGGQENGRRASTENVPAIVGLGEAAVVAADFLARDGEQIERWRDKLIRGILENIPEAKLNGHPTQRLYSNVNVSIPYVEGESMLLNLDLEDIAASTGSACSSGSLEPSHVLLALGLSHEEAHGSIRFSLGRMTTETEIDYVLEVFPKIVKKLREISPLYKKGGR